MPYQVTVLEEHNIIMTELIGVFSPEDIDDYAHFLLSSEVYRKNGRLMVDYSKLDEIPASYNHLTQLTKPMSELMVEGGEIWQAGVKATALNRGMSRQVNTLLELQNPNIDSVNLQFFDSREQAIAWLKHKPKEPVKESTD